MLDAMTARPASRGPKRPRASEPCPAAARIGVLVFAALIALGCEPSPEPARTDTAASPARASVDAARYAGSDSCVECHPAQSEAWRGSHHDLAMQEIDDAVGMPPLPSPELYLGDESLAFERSDGATRVRIRDERGEATHPVRYAFGVAPLQQFLVDGAAGRIQTLGWAWDSRPSENGGQRWFHLYADDPPARGDALHWSGRNQNWNFMCAECHSTGVERGYDAASDRFETRSAEIDVACEACHGPASRHVAGRREGMPIARDEILSLRASPGEWRIEPGARIARRSEPAHDAGARVDACAPCHSRRSTLVDGAQPGQPFLDQYLPALIEEGLYFADGQIDDEVYVYGSFLQSRMHAAGVVCGDCHDPHSLELRGDPEHGEDRSCLQCHAAPAFATRDHHRHPEASAGARCVSCHMPTRTYMQVDVRRDHSLRIRARPSAASSPHPIPALSAIPRR